MTIMATSLAALTAVIIALVCVIFFKEIHHTRNGKLYSRAHSSSLSSFVSFRWSVYCQEKCYGPTVLDCYVWPQIIITGSTCAVLILSL